MRLCIHSQNSRKIGCLLCRNSIKELLFLFFYINRGLYEEAKRRDVVEIPQSLVVYLVEVLILIKEIATESSLLRSSNITLTLQCK
jgi:hypothetical protein